uniref:LEM domain-containing protein n=1 Tax=Castor canadensis TaxID=51338 RepID=A0A8C0WC20_CASCN
MVDLQCLTNCELQNRLEKLGFSPGPILASTRDVYEKKLLQLLVSLPCEPSKDEPASCSLTHFYANCPPDFHGSQEQLVPFRVSKWVCESRVLGIPRLCF